MNAAKPLPTEKPSRAIQLRREIISARRAIKRLKKAVRESTSDIAKRGPVVIALRTDSHGAAHEKQVSNPALKTLRESQATMLVLSQRLKALELEFREAMRRESDDAEGVKTTDEFDF